MSSHVHEALSSVDEDRSPLAAVIVSHAYGNRCCVCYLKKPYSTIDTWLPESSKQSTVTPPIVALMTGWGPMVRVIRCLKTGEPCSPEPTTELIAVGPAENPAAVEDQVWQRHLAFASDSPSSCVLASGSNNIRHRFHRMSSGELCPGHLHISELV